MQFLDELAIAPVEALLGARSDMARIVDDGIGAVVEYELFRRNTRRELPPLLRDSSSAVVRQVSRLLDDPEALPNNLSLQPVPFDVTRIPLGLAAEQAWIAFLKRAEVTARAVGLGEFVAAGIAGAIGELADNIIRHSEAPESGLVGFARSPGGFEYVVADTGIGMLASLRRAPEFRSLRDDMEALPLSVTSGISRHGRGVGFGYGYRAVFSPLRAANGGVRLRSGAAVLEMAGFGATPDRGVCSQRPHHQGVTVSAVIFAT